MPFYKIVDQIIEMNPKYETLINQSLAYKIADEKELVNYTIDVSDEEITKCHDKYPHLDLNTCEYMIYGSKFYNYLINHFAFMLHASCVVYQNKAYLFSAPSGTGKSTHTKLWLEKYKTSYILNDDKPAIYIKDKQIYACGTPFSGKTNLNSNEIIEIQGIAFIIRSSENRIEKINTKESLFNLLNQTIRPQDEKAMSILLSLLEKVIERINCYKLYCNKTIDAARVAYEEMSK